MPSGSVPMSSTLRGAVRVTPRTAGSGSVEVRGSGAGFGVGFGFGDSSDAKVMASKRE